MLRVAIIGIGRVGGALARVLGGNEKVTVDAYDRETLRHTKSLESDVIVLSVHDSELATVAAQISPKLTDGAVALHTSGALTSDAISSLRSPQCSVGSMHPLVSLIGEDIRPNPFEGAHFGLEGDQEAVDRARKIVAAVGGNAFIVPRERKALYHAAAVAACGHVTALFALAAEMMQKAGVDDAEHVLVPLVESTITNIAGRGTTRALTGTFARADVAGLSRQIDAFRGQLDDDEREIYLNLGLRSLKLALTNGASPEAVEHMREIIKMAKAEMR